MLGEKVFRPLRCKGKRNPETFVPILGTYWSLLLSPLSFSSIGEKKNIYRLQPLGASVMVIVLFTAAEKQLCDMKTFLMCLQPVLKGWQREGEWDLHAAELFLSHFVPGEYYYILP